MLDWIKCNLLGKHDWFYHYRHVGGVREWEDGSFSTGPEHIGWVCTRCNRYGKWAGEGRRINPSSP